VGEDDLANSGGFGEEDLLGSGKVPPRPGTLRDYQRRIWLLLDDPSSSTTAKLLSSTMMIVILLSIGSFTVASAPAELWYTDVWVDINTGEVIVGSNATPQPPNSSLNDGPSLRQSELDENRHPFGEIETFCIMVFTTEFVLRLLASPEGPGVISYCTNWANIIDLVSIMPWYIEQAFSGSSLDVLSVLRLIRLTRITRIFKMSKNFQGLILLFTTLKKSAAALLMLFAFMGIFSILFATLIYTFEMGEYDVVRQQYVREDGSPSPFESIPSSLWWTIVTMTTVGYGDQYPVTDMGKVVAILTMFCGLVVLSLPITIIGANFDLEYRELKKLKQEEAERKRAEKRKEAAKLAAAGGEALSPRSAKSPSARSLGNLVCATSALSPRHSQNQGGVAGASPESSRLSKLQQQTSQASDGAGPPSTGLAAPAGGPTPSPAPSPPPEPVKEPASEDPIKLIQSMIHESNYKLLEEIDEVLERHENKLRVQIKDVLRRHAAGIDLQPTPLDSLKGDRRHVTEVK